MCQGSFNPKIRFLGQKVHFVAREQTDTKVNTEYTLSGFQECFLQPIIKDRSNNKPHAKDLLCITIADIFVARPKSISYYTFFNHMSIMY